MLDKFLEYLESHVGDIYVWGAEGQENPTESWIRNSETSEANANRAITLYNKRKAEGRSPIRAYDCSGYVSCALIHIGLMTGRRDCDGLWSRCTKIDAPKNGALLFRVNSENSSDETHVGVYFNGYQYHSKGRDVGVVKEKYKASYWAKVGWFKTLKETQQPIAETLYFSHLLKIGNVCPDVSKLKRLLIAKGISGVTSGNENYGKSTAAAVKKFQSANGLVADGVAGEATITKLGGKYVKEEKTNQA